MEYIYDAPYAAGFICNGELNWHDYYYISPEEIREDNCFYQINRTGIEKECPSLFIVERTAQSVYCEIFCILSGKGTLYYRDTEYQLRRGQIVFMNSHEEHTYFSDRECPLGMCWIEFLGSDSRKMMEKIIDRYSPVIEDDSLFRMVIEKIGMIQEKLSGDTAYDSSPDLYAMLYVLMKKNGSTGKENMMTISVPWEKMEQYIQAHLAEHIDNRELAALCGISESYFVKCFRASYRMTPHQYIQRKKILKTRYLLTQTTKSISQIAEETGYCNDSHFCRVFKQIEGMTPFQYRKQYGEYVK